MGSYVLQNTSYRAAVRPDGQLLVFTFRNGHEKNVYPHTDRWSLSCVGDVGQTLKHIGLTCAHLEDGLTQLPGDTSPADWAQTQLQALTEPVELIDLPESVIIREPDFKFWMASCLVFQGESHARQAFKDLLKRWGKQPGDAVSPINEPDLLVAIDGFESRCHDAWPTHPGQRLTGHQLPVVDQTTPHSEASPIAHAFAIEGMPGIAIWESVDGQWTIGGKLQLLQHYWKNIFPVQVSCSGPKGWRPSHQSLVEQITQQPALPADVITIRRPGADAPYGDIAQWSRIFGDEAETGSLHAVAQHLGGHILGELLLRSCSIDEVRLDPQTESEMEDQAAHQQS